MNIATQCAARFDWRTLGANTDFMNCPLLSEQLLLTSLSQNLVELHLTVHSDDQSQLNFDMDRLSGMSKLQHLHINSKGESRTWTTQGLLSSLTALEGFTF